jgi:hypothetical protein
MPIVLATQETEIRRVRVKSQPGQTVYETLCPKHPTQKRAGRVAKVKECQPSKHQALSSSHSNKKNKKKKKT